MVQPEWALIWHNKSNCDELQGQDEEFFTRFIFEYISFIAILNYQIVQTAYNNVGTINDLSIVDPSARKLINNIVNKNKYKDRDIIQILKNSCFIKDSYFEKIDNNVELENAWLRIIDCLNVRPLINSSQGHEHSYEHKYWNYTQLTLAEYEVNVNLYEDFGKVFDKRDWSNMIEFIYLIRNNLFHGSKDMSRDRDIFLVTHGHFILKPLVEILLRDDLIL